MHNLLGLKIPDVVSVENSESLCIFANWRLVSNISEILEVIRMDSLEKELQKYDSDTSY